MAYRLALPEASRVHPLFHVSQLKKFVAPKHQVLPCLPPDTSDLQIPMRVLQHRVKQVQNKTIAQVLVQWSGADESAATWEDLDSLKQSFPRAPAWGQAVSQGGGRV